MPPTLDHANEAVRAGLESLSETIAEVKPKLRGWMHLVLTPLALAGGIVLIVLSPDATTRWGSAVFAFSALLLFGISALYHTRSWSPRVWAALRRFDHANIFILIAGSYTPLTLMLLEGTERVVLLTTVWGCAILGVLFRVFWIGAPRWLYTPLYIGLGWAAVFFIPGFIDGAVSRLGTTTGTTVLVLVAVGGALYTLGGVVYGFKRPDPWPQWFGFHEVFHTFTILAFVSHYVSVSIATYTLR
ncbi:hemolysin III family protein [Nocardioides sp. cx-173]|uniref:PAQR family membrane homeostasis protein TrhA n=1 Tax=Nocardioides sp. cx-173 TaxID=2898796 RepID=UPI001E38A56C|nr:hemolysin III family protein [Nocardioides sp. cx-173]MCD4525525.1 hemolysin III family protein [Nocardioides sp. cx-173]UGB42669.1 hemolysin III family protein [Nocardioides sp. cx-173]